MAKSLKQQLNEQLATQHVQQALENIGMQQFQESFNQWNAEQDGLANFEAQYNAWSEANPVQTPEIVKETPKQNPIPSIADFFKPTTASGRDLNKEAANRQQQENYQRQQQEEAILASQGARQRRWDESVDNTLTMLNSDEFKDMAKKGKAQSIVEENKQRQKTQDAMREKQIASFDKYNTENLPQLTDDQKALEEQILNADRYVQDNPNKERWNERFLTAQEKSDAINNTTPEDVARWLSPDTKLTQKEKGIARAYAAAELAKIPTNGSTHQPMVQTDEERQHYADMVEIMNKTNPISSAMSGYMELPFNLVDMVGDAGRSVGNQISGLGAAVTDKLGITEGATQRHNERVEASNELANTNEENMRRSMANAQTQYPLANAGGKLAGQVTAYALTNPVFDGIAEGAGVTNQLAKFFVNQGAQNAQDLALDTAPLVKQLMSDGSMSEEDKREVFNNVVLNALGNAAMGTVQEIPNIAQYVGGKVDARRAADEAFRQNVREGADKLARLAGTEDVDNVVRNATRQAEEATQNIENIARQMPEIPEDIPVRPDTPVSPSIENAAEEISRAMDAEEAARAIEPPKAVENAAEGIENAAKTQQIETPKTNTVDIPEEAQEQIFSDFEEIYRSLDNMDRAANATGNAKAIEKFNKLQKSVFDYEEKVWNAETLEEVNKAKKAADAARQSFIREMKKIDPKYTGDLTGTKLGQAIYRRGNPKLSDADTQAMIDDWVQQDVNNPNRFVRDAEPDSTNVYRGVNDVPGAEPLQTFADGNGPKDQWKTSKARTNTIEKLGWGDQMPEKDFAYRVYSEAEQNADAVARYKDSQNVVADILNKNYEDYDELDVKMAYNEAQRLLDQGDRQSLAQAQRLMTKNAAAQRQSGRIVQASAEFTRNTAAGALGDAMRAEEDLVLEPWKSRNTKAREGNSRIAKALADMGHKADAKIKPELTHDQIKKGVIAELNREVGSVEQYFNDNDIEFLTQLAEDKSIPVWQITSEIEHKLNTGNWYTLDESIEMPKPTNRKLQNALDSLVTETVRAESEAPSLKQIAEEVRNTLGKESADFNGQFTDDDMDYLANLIHEGASKEELTDALDMKLATGSFGISDETLQEVNNIFKQISNYDPNSKQFVEGQAEAYRLLANEILPNATFKEKFEAWRYIAMLGNPKTMLRNYIGNQTFNVVTGISNNVAAIAEAGIDRASKALGGEGIQRTKAILNPVTDSGLIKAAAEDADASRYRQIIGSKYEKMSKDTLRRSKSVFNSKLAQLYEKVTDAGISDYSAVKKKYSTSLAGYMKANGMSTDIFKAEDELRNLKNLGETRLLSDAEKARAATLSNQVQELEKARDYALKQAEYATFHEDNDFAKWLSESSSKAPKPIRAMIEGVVPFKKTPANVLKSGYHYSPMGAIDSIKKTGKLIYENTGGRKGNLADVYKNKAGKEVARTLASDVIDSWSKTLTGTGLTGLGIYLYNKGILHSSDPDTKYQDELEGHQNYAIEINGKSYTIDWAAPTIMPLMIGAEIAKVWDSTGKGDEDLYNNLDDYIALANRLADPLIETSMLSGVKDTLDTAASAAQNNENLNIPALLIYNTLTGYASQGVPTIAGQIARTIDPTRRSTYTDKEGVPGILDKQLKKQMNKIPGASMLNQPYVDTYGREQQNGPFNNPLARLGYQMFSPGYLTNINETDADRISREAYEVGNVANTLPKWQSKFKDAEGNRVSPEDYTTASKAYGQANYKIREALANDEWFNSLEGTQKEEIVKGINTIAEHVGNAAIDPNYTKDSKAYNAYKDGGISGLLDYYKGETAKDTAKDLLGDSGVTTNSNAGKAITEAVKNGNMAQAEKLAEQAKEEKAEKVKVEETKADLSSYGLTSISPAKTYEKAQDIIPGLTMEKFATTYKKIDADGNQGIKQDEVISYLNSQKITSESEAKKIWSAYGNSTWKSIPKLENGKWVKKKK